LKDYRHRVPWATTRTSFVDFNNAYAAIDSEGRTIWIVDAHRGDGKRFVVHADEKLTAFVELESAISACGELIWKVGEIFAKPSVAKRMSNQAAPSAALDVLLRPDSKLLLWVVGKVFSRFAKE
jgi:hypothetical protein